MADYVPLAVSDFRFPNLIRAVAAIGHEPTTGASGGDREIRAKLLTKLIRREWARVWPEDIVPQDAVVHLRIMDTPQRNGRRCAPPPRSSRVRRVEEHVVPVPSFPVLRRTQPSGYRYSLIPRQEKYLLSRFADGCRRADGICCTDQDRRRMQ